MKFRMDKTLRFWVDCSYEDRKHENANRTRAELIAEILRDYERSGHAMRYLNAKGHIAWRASPAMLRKLADAEREVEDDMEGLTVRASTTAADTIFPLGGLKNVGPGPNPLFEGSAEARPVSGAHCLGGLPGQS